MWPFFDLNFGSNKYFSIPSDFHGLDQINFGMVRVRTPQRNILRVHFGFRSNFHFFLFFSFFRLIEIFRSEIQIFDPNFTIKCIELGTRAWQGGALPHWTGVFAYTRLCFGVVSVQESLPLPFFTFFSLFQFHRGRKWNGGFVPFICFCLGLPADITWLHFDKDSAGWNLD